jgi:hypothetical protein
MLLFLDSVFSYRLYVYDSGDEVQGENKFGLPEGTKDPSEGHLSLG